MKNTGQLFSELFRTILKIIFGTISRNKIRNMKSIKSIKHIKHLKNIKNTLNKKLPVTPAYCQIDRESCFCPEVIISRSYLF